MAQMRFETDDSSYFGGQSSRSDSSSSSRSSYHFSPEELAELEKTVKQAYSAYRRSGGSQEQLEEIVALARTGQSQSSYLSSLADSLGSSVNASKVNKLHNELNAKLFALGGAVLLGAGLAGALPGVSGLLGAGSTVGSGAVDGSGAVGGAGIVDDVIYNVGEDAIPPITDKFANTVSDTVGSSWLEKLLNSLGGFAKDAFSGLTASIGGIAGQLGSSILNYNNQVRLIDKQNAYNTPAAQMQRFADAGLNPNLVYGMGSNGNQPASGSVAPVDFDTAQRENRLAKMQIGTQTAMAKADIADKMASVQLKDAQAQGVSEETANTRLQNQVFLENFKNQQNLLIAQYEKLIEEKREAMANADSAEARAMYANDIERLNKEIAEQQKKTEQVIANWAETRQVTGAIGDIFHLGAGLNVGFGRSWSNVSTSKK